MIYPLRHVSLDHLIRIRRMIVWAILFLMGLGHSTDSLRTEIIVIPAKGDGSQEHPYEIESLNNLYWLSINKGLWAKGCYFIQTADIDASQTRRWNISGEDTLGFEPIGNMDVFFMGSYNGKGYKISNLYINRPETEYVGLFGLIHNTMIDSLHLENISVKGYRHVGGLIGGPLEDRSVQQVSRVSYCSVTGSVSGIGNQVGGLLGYASHTAIQHDSTDVVLEGRGYVGGLVGKMFSVFVDSCFVTGSISANGDYVGGLAGYAEGNSVWHSSADVILEGTSNNVGGLIGETYSVVVANCFAEGFVYGKRMRVGGLIGYAEGESIQNCSTDVVLEGSSYHVGGLVGNIDSVWVQSCQASGQTKGGISVGGLVGTSASHSKILNSKSSGYVQGNQRVGGLVGLNDAYAYISYSYSEAQVIGGDQVSFGGLVGENKDHATIWSSYSTGNVKAIGEYIGGSVGLNTSYATMWGVYSTGQVEGPKKVGGLVGQNETFSLISNCFSTGAITNLDNDAGGMVGNDLALVEASYWDVETSGMTESSAGVGLTTNQMKKQSSYQEWGFVSVSNHGNRDIWNLTNPSVNQGYPYFYWQDSSLATVDTQWKPQQKNLAVFQVHAVQQNLRVSYSSYQAGVVKLGIYSLQGHQQDEIYLESEVAGNHEAFVPITWKSGAYLAILSADHQVVGRQIFKVH